MVQSPSLHSKNTWTQNRGQTLYRWGDSATGKQTEDLTTRMLAESTRTVVEAKQLVEHRQTEAGREDAPTLLSPKLAHALLIATQIHRSPGSRLLTFYIEGPLLISSQHRPQ